MKVKEKNQARELRLKGLSVNEIREKLNVAKSSVSIWVRDIQLSEDQLQGLSIRGRSKKSIEKRRKARLANERAKRAKVIARAKEEFTSLVGSPLFLTGVSLYWSEGGKTKRSLVRLDNSDPEMIKVFMRFLREFCEVPEEKFRGHIHIHSHLAVEKAEHYWSEITKIPINQFFKTYSKPSKASKGKRDSLPHGTFDVYVCDTELFLKIKGWSQGLVQYLAK